MKIIGTATLVFRDKITGKITKEITKDNNVTDEWIQIYMAANSTNSSRNYGKFGGFIFISEFNPVSTDPKIWYIPESHAVGFTDTANGVVSPILVPGTITTFPYGIIQQRFAPPAADLTISVVGLTNDTSVPTTTREVWSSAWLKLSTPVTQLTTETLDIFYRVQFPYSYWDTPPDDSPVGLSGYQADVVADRFIITATAAEYFNAVMTYYNGNIQPAQFSRFPTGENLSAETSSKYSADVITKSVDKSAHKYDTTALFTIDKGLGEIVGFTTWGVGTSSDTHNSWARKLEVDVDIQNIFGHGPTAIKPFFDANFLPTTDGTITLDGSSWTNPDFPKMYRINFTTDGIIGTSEYNFQVRNVFGFLSNTYKDNVRVVSGLNYENAFAHGGLEFINPDQTGTPTSDFDRPTIIKYKIDDTIKNLIAINKTEIYPFNLQDEQGVMINSTTVPLFTATNITQVVHDAAGTIYVACRDSGIYKIVTPLGTPTITKIDNTTTGLDGGGVSNNCYGIDIGVGGRLWSMWEGGLFYSDDSGANWDSTSFTNATITTTWSRVKYIKADPTIVGIDHRLGIVYESNATVGSGSYMEQTVLWWDTANAAGTIGKQFIAYDRANSFMGFTRFLPNEPWTYFTTLAPSPTGNKWGAMIKSATWQTDPFNVYPAYLDFNATTYTLDTVNTVTLQSFIDWELDATGTDEVIVSSGGTSTANVYATQLKDDGNSLKNTSITATSKRGDTESMYEGPVCYLGNLVYLSYNPENVSQKYNIISLGDETDPAGGPLGHLLWDSYGWNSGGSVWELNNVNAKPTHIAAEVLNDGITIAFDDAGGTQTFVTGDYFTTGAVKGVWLDGSTQLEVKSGLYFKSMIQNQTTLQSGTLPAGTSSPEIFESTPDVITWQDEALVTTNTDNIIHGSATVSSYESGARSNETITKTGITDKSGNDTLYGRFAFSIYTRLIAADQNITAGLSSINVLTNPIDPNTVEYGWQIHWTGTSDPDEATCSIIQSGSIVAADVVIVDTNTSAIDFEVEILNDGTVNYYVSSTATLQSFETCTSYLRKLVHTSAGAPIVDYYIDVALNGTGNRAGIAMEGAGVAATLSPAFDSTPSTGSKRLTRRVADDYYMTIGDFATSKGRYEPTFFAIDNTQNFDVLINGVAPTLILKNDITTVLSTGEISVFAREGFIRYSAADTDKTISADYHVLVRD